MADLMTKVAHLILVVALSTAAPALQLIKSVSKCCWLPQVFEVNNGKSHMILFPKFARRLLVCTLLHKFFRLEKVECNDFFRVPLQPEWATAYPITVDPRDFTCAPDHTRLKNSLEAPRILVIGDTAKVCPHQVLHCFG
jgi:hypothetical protein